MNPANSFINGHYLSHSFLDAGFIYNIYIYIIYLIYDGMVALDIPHLYACKPSIPHI